MDRMEIIESIAAVFKQACPKTGTEQPHVYFRGKNVLSDSRTQCSSKLYGGHMFCFKGKRMYIVSKGLKGCGVRVLQVQGLESKRLEDARKSMESYDWSLAVAHVYEVVSLGGGPIFSGDLFIFATRDITLIVGKAVLPRAMGRLITPSLYSTVLYVLYILYSTSATEKTLLRGLLVSLPIDAPTEAVHQSLSCNRTSGTISAHTLVSDYTLPNAKCSPRIVLVAQ